MDEPAFKRYQNSGFWSFHYLVLTAPAWHVSKTRPTERALCVYCVTCISRAGAAHHFSHIYPTEHNWCCYRPCWLSPFSPLNLARINIICTAWYNQGHKYQYRRCAGWKTRGKQNAAVSWWNAFLTLHRWTKGDLPRSCNFSHFLSGGLKNPRSWASLHREASTQASKKGRFDCSMMFKGRWFAEPFSITVPLTGRSNGIRNRHYGRHVRKWCECHCVYLPHLTLWDVKNEDHQPSAGTDQSPQCR